MEKMVVMFPSLGIGHLISMIELGTLILKNDPSLAITILLTQAHYETNSTSNYIKTVTLTTPSITFHRLPALSHPPDPSTPFFDLVFRLTKLYKPIVRDVLRSIMGKSTVKGVILDFLSNDAFEVCKSLNIPTYYLFTGSAFGLGIMLYIRTLHDKISESFGNLRGYIEAPGTPPIYSLDMPVTMVDRNSYSYKNILDISKNMAKAQGINHTLHS